jgi:hypothetical protein
MEKMIILMTAENLNLIIMYLLTVNKMVSYLRRYLIISIVILILPKFANFFLSQSLNPFRGLLFLMLIFKFIIKIQKYAVNFPFGLQSTEIIDLIILFS